MEEIYKDIIGYEGLYQISNYGNIKSLERKHHRGGIKKERILKLRIDNDGYNQIILWKNSMIKSYRVHRLVLQTFLPTDNVRLQVNHKDGIKTNNYIDNLEWCMQSQNMKHAFAIGLKNHIGKNNPNWKNE